MDRDWSKQVTDPAPPTYQEMTRVLRRDIDVRHPYQGKFVPQPLYFDWLAEAAIYRAILARLEETEQEKA